MQEFWLGDGDEILTATLLSCLIFSFVLEFSFLALKLR